MNKEEFTDKLSDIIFLYRTTYGLSMISIIDVLNKFTINELKKQ